MTQTWASKCVYNQCSCEQNGAVGLLRTCVIAFNGFAPSCHIKFVAKPSALFFKLLYSTFYVFPHHLVLVVFLTSSSTLVQSQLYVKTGTNYEALHYQVFSKLMLYLCHLFYKAVSVKLHIGLVVGYMVLVVASSRYCTILAFS